ncbi:alkaline phosphatase D family protein [Hoyosella sp. G463]|uniref:Alkaline phosphatase D family protein n=1 Tax=Lolliginicoccus lacisalsi TaxID=2742202 RepID=A0A927J9Z0_9ACTN|nr:alkaline phosphatase D family protein [Lolliginicoccus lacisalsi]MBD8505303.1 alkaline phosphatase D family protein [Lolliginicoccus lacisalsi]
MTLTQPVGPSRRTVLRAGAALSGLALSGAAGARIASAPPGGIFLHGVASGDPTSRSVMLWTRVTPVPEAVPGSGAGPDSTIHWEIATDPGFAARIASGTASTGAWRDHTVLVDAGGLAPSTTYYYRFLGARGEASPTGATRTTPAPGTLVDRLRLGVVSCANWEAGTFSAYRHLASRGDLDAIVHLGDYLYENGQGEYGGKNGSVRLHQPPHEIVSLADYRQRHGQYKTDPDLQNLHATVPVIAIWDDHESANDAWRGGAENHDPSEGSWSDRYEAALQAYLEWMPIRPGGAGRTLYRRISFGSLAELSMLDLRSYRDRPAATGSDGRAIDDPARTIAGAEQLDWLIRGTTTSTAQWQLIGNPVMIAPIVLPPLEPATTEALTSMLGIPRGGIAFNGDQWDGYTSDRAALFTALDSAPARNAVFLTGDIHSSWASELPRNAARYPGAGTVGVEYVVPSVTSKNIDDILRVPPRTVSPAIENALRATNQHVRFVELDSHGYGVLEVTTDHAQMDWWFITDPADPGARARHAHSLRTTAGSGQLGPAAPLPPRPERR